VRFGFSKLRWVFLTAEKDARTKPAKGREGHREDPVAMHSADELFSDGQTFTERVDASTALVNQTFIERTNHFVTDQEKKKKKAYQISPKSDQVLP
jgi:hypothetical protein